MILAIATLIFFIIAFVLFNITFYAMVPYIGLPASLFVIMVVSNAILGMVIITNIYWLLKEIADYKFEKQLKKGFEK